MTTPADDFLLGGQSRVENGRYAMPDPEDGRERRWTRVTTQAELLSDTFALTRWQLRELLRGLALRPDLVARLVATVDLDNAAMDEIIASAHGAVGTDASANLGTAVHEALRAADTDRPVAERFRPHVEAYRAELARNGLSVVAVEQTVMCRPLGTVGTLDRLYRQADGTVVVGDVKTGGHLERYSHDAAAQLAQYATATHFWDQGRQTWLTHDGQVRDDVALVVHVDPETGATALYYADVAAGRRAVNLSVQVREWRKTRGLLLPYVPPVAVPRGPAADKPEPTSTQAQVSEPPAGSDATSPAPEPAGSPLGVPAVDPEAEAEELAKLSKAKLQQMCREAGIADVAHTRAILAKMLVGRRNRAAGSEQAGAQAVTQMLTTALDAAERGQQARDDAFHRLRLDRVRGAKSVAELAAVRAEIVRVDGDQGWTDELTAAARERAAALGEPVGMPTASTLGSTALAQVQAAATSADLARLWETWTVGGSVPTNWPPAVDAAARARLAEITAAAPPPPANPFA